MGKFVTIGTVQKLSTLLPSSAPAQQKLEVAAMVAESASSTWAVDNSNKKSEMKKKLQPDATSRVSFVLHRVIKDP